MTNDFEGSRKISIQKSRYLVTLHFTKRVKKLRFIIKTWRICEQKFRLSLFFLSSAVLCPTTANQDGHCTGIQKMGIRKHGPELMLILSCQASRACLKICPVTRAKNTEDAQVWIPSPQWTGSQIWLKSKESLPPTVISYLKLAFRYRHALSGKPAGHTGPAVAPSGMLIDPSKSRRVAGALPLAGDQQPTQNLARTMVEADGLILTDHHLNLGDDKIYVAAGQLDKLHWIGLPYWVWGDSGIWRMCNREATTIYSQTVVAEVPALPGWRDDKQEAGRWSYCQMFPICRSNQPTPLIYLMLRKNMLPSITIVSEKLIQNLTSRLSWFQA